MSVSKLPSGRWRAQVWSSRRGHNVSVWSVIGGAKSFATKNEAKIAREKARAALRADGESTNGGRLTVEQWAAIWTTDPLYRRPKESTNIYNAERIRRFVAEHADTPLADIGDWHIARWIAGGKNLSTVASLKAMFADATTLKAGRLLRVNPWSGFGPEKGRGRADVQPPSEEKVWEIITAARKLTGPSFAAWLQVACFTGMRPGELDALRWESVDFERGRIRVSEQFSATSRNFTLPKNGKARDALLTPQARQALLGLPRESEFCFVTLRGSHWTASARAYHWKAVRAAANWDDDLYLATRHFAGWYMVNVLDLDEAIVAIALGHEDGGELVRRLYGHRDKDRALDRAAQAYERMSNVVPIRGVTDAG